MEAESRDKLLAWICPPHNFFKCAGDEDDSYNTRHLFYFLLMLYQKVVGRFNPQTPGNYNDGLQFIS